MQEVNPLSCLLVAVLEMAVPVAAAQKEDAIGPFSEGIDDIRRIHLADADNRDHDVLIPAANPFPQ